MLRLRMRYMKSTVPDWTINLGADKTESHGDIAAPYDSRAGYRINVNNKQQQTGQSPDDQGGPIVTWTDDGSVSSPNTWGLGIFEYKWEEVSDSGIDTKVIPVAVSTYEPLDAVKTWYAQNLAGGDTWVIDVTVREIADAAEIDTVRVTMEVEGVV